MTRKTTESYIRFMFLFLFPTESIKVNYLLIKTNNYQVLYILKSLVNSRKLASSRANLAVFVESSCLLTFLY